MNLNNLEREMMNFLGKGGFGYVEKYNYNGVEVAKKTLVLSANPYNQNENLDLIRRFTREVSYQSRLSHKNVVRIIADMTGENFPAFLMPLAQCHLGQEPSKAISFDLDAKIRAIHDVINGLDFIHKNGMLHRDIKPGNILRFEDGNGFYYAISDFGLVSQSENSNSTILTMLGNGGGTEYYLAPEVFLNGFSAASAASDIYSLGVVIQYLFENNLGTPYKQRFGLNLFNQIIEKATVEDVKLRYQSINELRSDFEAIISKIGKNHIL